MWPRLRPKCMYVCRSTEQQKHGMEERNELIVFVVVDKF